MASNVLSLARKIIKGINVKYNSHLVICMSTFYRNGEEVNIKILKDAFYGEDGYCEKMLFRTGSSIYMCLYARDILDTLDGRDLAEFSHPGYEASFLKNNGEAGLNYMKEVYIGTDGQLT